ncbi:AMP-binding protein [Mesobacterium sp. TK19101]|uniref:AMP-binding protein n=1 Tax=Mesobacterium hydrothermale TaxID=3111907 RepID=A0ABU6HPF6_9RHOB|nr:AMP-binding protein [Mesobacterium sp. TK19101]MEC3863120.1 AMP-binding protein [Mesobacterium sp. TK19101]
MKRFLESIRKHAATRPDHPAIVEDDTVVGYAQLDALSDRLALDMITAGLKPGDRIGCLKSNMITMFVTALAGLKTGVVYIVLDIRESEERKAHILGLADARLIVGDQDASRTFAKDQGLPYIHAPDLSPAQTAFVPRALPDTATCWIEPTSGSTSLPKLVASSRACLQHYVDAQVAHSGLQASDRIALFGELWCDTLFAGLAVGASAISYDLRGRGAAPLADWMADQHITATQTYVAAFRAMAQAVRTPLSKLRIVRLAGETVLPGDVAAFERIAAADACLINYYGATECGFLAQYTHRKGQPNPYRVLPIGKVIAGSKIEVVDDAFQPVPQGVTGRILYLAPHLPDGYFKNPEKTAETYLDGTDGMRVWNTGDLGYLDDDGLYHVVGRADDQVKIRGYSVRYSEIEQALVTHPDLEAVVVTSFLSPRGQRQLSAHIIVAAGKTFDPLALKGFLAERLPAYMVPTYFLAHDSFPRTDTGKVLRRGLPNPLDALEAGGGLDTTQLNACEKTVAHVWSRILGHDGYSAEEDFFDVGGDSLQAMEVVVELERQLKVRIGYESLIMHGASIRAIAARIQNAAQMQDRVLTLNAGQTTPLYVLPVENGEFSDWLYMMRAFGDDLTVKGVHVRDLSKRDCFNRRTTAELAEYAAQSILAENPNGPYFLAGFSMGTQLAFETACRLTALGKTVEGLVLLDPPVLKYEDFSKSWWIRKLASALLKQRDLGLTLNRFGHVFLKTPARELHFADETAFRTYRPKKCKIPNVLFLTARDLNPHRDVKLAYWQDLVGGAAEVREVPGTHNSIVRDPNAPATAKAIEHWFRTRLASPNMAKTAHYYAAQ